MSFSFSSSSALRRTLVRNAAVSMPSCGIIRHTFTRLPAPASLRLRDMVARISATTLAASDRAKTSHCTRCCASARQSTVTEVGQNSQTLRRDRQATADFGLTWADGGQGCRQSKATIRNDFAGSTMPCNILDRPWQRSDFLVRRLGGGARRGVGKASDRCLA